MLIRAVIPAPSALAGPVVPGRVGNLANLAPAAGGTPVNFANLSPSQLENLVLRLRADPAPAVPAQPA